MTQQEKRSMAKALPHLDPETITFLKRTLDEAWDCLSPERQATMLKTSLAERILKSAAQGERDRERLLNAALTNPAA
jgi:hypothetical protein